MTQEYSPILIKNKLHDFLNPLTPQNLTSNSLYCLTYNSYGVNLENLVLGQLIIP